MKKRNLIIGAKAVIAYAQIANLILHFKAKDISSNRKSIISLALFNAALAGVAGGLLEIEKEKNYEH